MNLSVKRISRGIAYRAKKILNINVDKIDFSKIRHSTSISDGFIWRTDGSYKTIFRFSDIFRLFYNIKNSDIDLSFYDKNYNLIKELKLENIELSNEIIIDKKFLNNKEDYGIFHIFHKKQNLKLDNMTILSNRCYLGFSSNSKLPSFVHGNTYTMSKNIDGEGTYSDFIKKTFFCTNRYRIQNSFKDFEKTELFFVNPSSKKIIFYLNDEKYELNGFCSKIISINN